MTAINQRWYSGDGTVRFVHPDDPHAGEVRITIFENNQGEAYILNHSPGPTNEQGLFISNQLNGAVGNEVYNEDFTWVQEMIDELLVPDEKCKVAWGACRGAFKSDRSGTKEPDKFDDVIALIITADLYADPANPQSHFRIATFPIGPWEDRQMAVEQGLRSMALQRFAREQLVGAAAKNYNATHVPPRIEAQPVPLPGLRLTRHVEPEIDPDGDGVTRFKDTPWDLTSEAGGLGQPFELVDG